MKTALQFIQHKTFFYHWCYNLKIINYEFNFQNHLLASTDMRHAVVAEDIRITVDICGYNVISRFNKKEGMRNVSET